VVHYGGAVAFARKQPVSNNVAGNDVLGYDALRKKDE
jgi:hypothetical protein